MLEIVSIRQRRPDPATARDEHDVDRADRPAGRQVDEGIGLTRRPVPVELERIERRWRQVGEHAGVPGERHHRARPHRVRRHQLGDAVDGREHAAARRPRAPPPTGGRPLPSRRGHVRSSDTIASLDRSPRPMLARHRRAATAMVAVLIAAGAGCASDPPAAVVGLTVAGCPPGHGPRQWDRDRARAGADLGPRGQGRHRDRGHQRRPLDDGDGRRLRSRHGSRLPRRRWRAGAPGGAHRRSDRGR